MISEENAKYTIDITIHIFILFTFLSIFFFTFASKLAKQSINDALTGIINVQVEQMLTNVDKWDKKIAPISYPNINWNVANKIAKKIEVNAQGELPDIVANNKKLLWIGIGIITNLFIFVVALYIYFRFVKLYDINIGRIITHNIILFIFIGIIEYFFFTLIAAKYIPVTPDFVASTLLDRIKYKVSQLVMNK